MCVFVCVYHCVHLHGEQTRWTENVFPILLLPVSALIKLFKRLPAFRIQIKGSNKENKKIVAFPCLTESLKTHRTVEESVFMVLLLPWLVVSEWQGNEADAEDCWIFPSRHNLVHLVKWTRCFPPAVDAKSSTLKRGWFVISRCRFKTQKEVLPQRGALSNSIYSLSTEF